jgi:hypothetical protein
MSRNLKTWTRSGGSFVSLQAHWAFHEKKERAGSLLTRVTFLQGSGVLFTF